MHKLRGTLSLFLLVAGLLLGRSSMLAQAHPQPYGLWITPTVVPRGECYTIIVGGGGGMTLDTDYFSDNAGSGVLHGWPSLDGSGSAEICTDSGTPLGNYYFRLIRNTLNTEWVNLSWVTGYPKVLVVDPLPQPTGMSFAQPYGFAGNDSYTLTIANGANMEVEVLYTLNGTLMAPGTIFTDGNGRYTYNLEQSIWTGDFVFYGLRNALSSQWVNLSQPVYYTIYPPHPKSLSLSPTTLQAGGGSYRVTVGNGAWVTLDTLASFNDVVVNPPPYNWPSLVPESQNSEIGVADVDVGLCVKPGIYKFLAVRNHANGDLHDWLELNNPITVTPPAVPSVSGQTVTSAARGATGTITISGSRLCNVSLQTSWPGLSFASIPSSQGPNQVSTTFAVTSGAAIGTASVTLHASGGDTTFNFTIMATAPTVTGISPAVGPRGGSLQVTFTGTNLVGVNLTTIPAGSGLSFSNVSSNAQGTSLTATFSIAPDAPLGHPTIKITNAAGYTTTAAYEIVTPPPPTISSISPAIGLRGTNVPVTISGTNLYGPSLSTTQTWGSHLSFTNIVPSTDGASMTATLVIASSAPTGYPPIRVDTPGGNATTTLFYVSNVPPPPTLTREYIYLGDRVIAVEAP